MRTAFNILGPMLNPAMAPYALVGVYTPSLMGLMGSALQRLGVRKVREVLGAITRGTVPKVRGI